MQRSSLGSFILYGLESNYLLIDAKSKNNSIFLQILSSFIFTFLNFFCRKNSLRCAICRDMNGMAEIAYVDASPIKEEDTEQTQ